jgi:hypothetical protein
MLSSDVVLIDQRLLVEVLVVWRRAEEAEDLRAKVFCDLPCDGVDSADRLRYLEELLLEEGIDSFLYRVFCDEVVDLRRASKTR